MKQNLSSMDKKKIIMDIIAQVGLQNQKPEKKIEIINYLQLAGPGQQAASLGFFKDRLADWVIANYSQLRTNTLMFLQYGNLKFLSKETRDLLTLVVKNCQQKLGDSIDYNDMFHGIFMKNPYLGYQHMNYMYPPYMMPSGYSSDRQNYENYQKMYNMDLQQYYMQMSKYGYPVNPVNQLFMPPVPMGVPKYPSSNNPQLFKQFFPYPMPPISNPTFTQTQPQPQVAQQKPKSQVQIIPNKKSNQVPTSVKPNKQPYPQKQVEEVDNNSKKIKQKQNKQPLKNYPFQIIPPSQCKVPRQQIPERLISSQPSESVQIDNQINTLNIQSPDIQQIQIVQKQKKNDFGTDKARVNTRPKRNPTPTPYPQPPVVNNLPLIHKTQSEQDRFKKNINELNIQKNYIQIGLQYKQEFKECCCKGFGVYNQSYQCSCCGKKYHYYCTSKKQIKTPMEQQTAEVCHFCFMKNLDPLNKVQAQIKTSYIMDIKHNKFLQYIDFQAYDAYINKTSPYQIEVRSMRLQDASNLVAQFTWPDECLVMLNQQKTIEFQALQHNSSLKKRKDMSIFLTSYIYYYNKNYVQRKNMPIGLQIKENSILEMTQKKIRNNYIFLFGIYLVKKKTPDELCDQIMKDPNNKVNFAEKFFSQNTAEQQDIQIQQIKVNLMDPFTWNLIDIPVRGRKCIHGQCFDLKTFLSFMNVQKVRQWRCPVCNKQCRNFYVDTQQLQVIRQFKKHESQGNHQKFSKQISFHRDGRTLFIVQNEEDQQDEDKNVNSGEMGKTKMISKDDKQSK